MYIFQGILRQEIETALGQTLLRGLRRGEKEGRGSERRTLGHLDIRKHEFSPGGLQLGG